MKLLEKLPLSEKFRSATLSFTSKLPRLRKPKTKRQFLTIGASSVLTLFVLGLILSPTREIMASWYNDNWLYRTPITIDNTGSAQTEKKVKVEVDTATLISNGKMQEDCGDSRFTTEDGELLDYTIGTNAAATSTISFNADTTSSSASFSEPYTFSHTVNSGTDSMLVLIIHGMVATGTPPYDDYFHTVTYAGEKMVRQAHARGQTTNREYVSEIWTLVNPSTGSNTVSISWGGAVWDIIAESMTFFGVDQFDGTGATDAILSTAVSSVDLTLETEADDSVIVYGGAISNANDRTLSISDGTEEYQVSTGTTSSDIKAVGGYYAAGAAGSKTVTTSSTGSETAWFSVGIELKPSRNYDLSIQRDGYTSFESSIPTGTSESFSHTVNAGSDRALVVVIGIYEAAACSWSCSEDVTAVTYNGTALTQQVDTETLTLNRYNGFEIWTLANPATGSNTLQITLGSATRQIHAFAVNYTGVDQTLPFGAVGSNAVSVGGNLEISADVASQFTNSLIVTGGYRQSDHDQFFDLPTSKTHEVVAQSITGEPNDNNSVDAFALAFGELQSDYAEVETITYNTIESASYSMITGGVELNPASDPYDACNHASTDYLVALPSIPADESIIYHYYGYSAAENGWEGVQIPWDTFVPNSVTGGTEETNETTGPVAQWTFGETSGDVIHDSTGRHDFYLGQAAGSTTLNTITTSTVEGEGGNEGAYRDQVFFDPHNDRWHVLYVDSSSDIHTQSTAYNSGTVWTDGVDVIVSGDDYEGIDCTLDTSSGTSNLHCVYTDGGADTLVYVTCELTGTTPYISCGSTSNIYDASAMGGESSDDIVYTAIEHDSDSCLVVIADIEDDSEDTDYEHEIWLWKEAAPCGDGIWTTRGGFPKEDIAPVLGYKNQTPVGIASYGDRDMFLIWHDRTINGTTPAYGMVFDGDTDSFGELITISSDIEASGSDNNQSIVTYNDDVTLFANVDTTLDLSSFTFTSKSDTTASVVDTNINNPGGVDTVAVNTTTAEVDYNANGSDDLWVFSQSAGQDDVVYNASTDGGTTWGGTETVWVDSATSGDDEVKFFSSGYNPKNCDIMVRWVGDTVTPWDIRTRIINTGNCSNNPPTKVVNQVAEFPQAYLRFDGTNDHTRYPDHDDFDFGTDSFTVEGWFRHTEAIAGTDVLLSKYNEAGFKVYMNSSGNLCFGTDDDSTWGPDDSACSSADYSDSTWHHFSAVKTSTSSIALFIDGLNVITNSSTGADSTLNNTDPFYFGIDADGSSNPWAGDLAQITVYPYARSTDQIKSAYAGGGSGHVASARFGSTSADVDLESGLVGYWAMEEDSWNGTSDEVTDSSGNSNHGVRVGNSTTVPAIYGSGGTFDGSGDYLTITDDNSLKPSEEVTVAAWVRPTFFANQDIVNKGDGSGTGAGYRMYLYSDSDVGFWVYDGAGDLTIASTSNNPVVANTGWYHLVGTYDGTNARLYIDGELAATSVSTSGLTQKSQNLFVGGSTSFTGVLDEARIYNRALSGAEVKRLYNWAPGPIAYYPLNEGSGTSSVYDISGNNLNGVLQGSMTEADWGPGKYGSALEFDGVDDVIEVLDDTMFDFGTDLDFTVSSWVKLTDSGADQRIIEEVSPTAGFFFVKYDDSDAVIHAGIGDAGYCLIKGSTNIADGSWHHVAVTFNRNSTCTTSDILVFVDGIEETASASQSGGDTTDENLDFGGIEWSHNTDEIFGLMDELQLFNYALTSKNIINVMNGRKPGDSAVGSPFASPLGHWSFDEGYGTVANDKGTGGNNGTITNASWSNDGKFGKALDFDDSGDYVDMGDLFYSDVLTVCTWFKMDTDDAHDSLVVKRNVVGGVTAGTAEWELATFSSTSIRWLAWNPSVVSDVTASGLDSLIGKWTHVCAVNKGAGLDSQLYVDGVLEASAAQGLAMGDTTSSIQVGARTSGTDSRYWDGLIDEVKIYNYALTSDEVLLDFNQGKSAVFGSTSTTSTGVADWSAAREYCVPGDTSTCNPPILHYTFDEGVDNLCGTDDVCDRSNNSNDGTKQNMSATNWVAGVLGGAIDFDGTNDRIDVGSVNIPDETAAFSIGVWLYPRSVAATDQCIYCDSNGIAPSLYMNNGQLIYCGDNVCSNTASTSTGVITANEWQHISFSYDGAGTAAMYRNGLDVTNDVTVAETSNGQTVEIGDASGYSVEYNGLMDQLLVFDYVRTPAQVAWEYNQGAPIAHYKFDECSGTTIYNSAPAADGEAAGNNGSLVVGGSDTNTSAGTCDSGTGSELWNNGTTGKYNSAMHSDGTDDSVTLSATTVPRDYGTISYWINPTVVNTFQSIVYTSDGTGTIDYNGFGAAANILEIHSGLYTDGRVYFLYQDGASFGPDGQEALYSSTYLSAGTWYHIALAYDDTDSIQMYVNGRLEIDRDISGLTFSDNTQSASFLSRTGQSSSTRTYDGLLDDVKIWNYPLTPEQVLMDYNRSAVRFD